MAEKPKSWLVIGVPDNWDTSLSQPIPLWGLKMRYDGAFQSLHPGDYIWIYVTAPVQGLVGIGVVRDKYTDNTNLVWPEELQKKETIWPLRFRIQILKLVPRSSWKTAKVAIDDLGLNRQMGFQALGDHHVAELAKRSEWIPGADLYQGATIIQDRAKEQNVPFEIPSEVNKPPARHRGLQQLVAEIGKLQYYHTELEYAIDLKGEHKSLDVVWKREVSGSPTFAFEIELSAGLEKAVGRLRFAYKRWNSRPRIIVPSEDFRRVENIVATEDREFSQQLRIYEPGQLEALLEKKRNLKVFEQDLGMY